MKDTKKYQNTYLGLDIGTASIGYALIDEINHSIIASGVRIFPEALEGRSEEKKPRNVERRKKRLRRRQIRHKKLKQNRIRKILSDARLLPSAEKSVLEQTPKNTSPNEPYDLRKRALNEKLDPYELGRVFTHISRRIGFSGSVKRDDLAEDEKTDEQKKQEKDENEIKEEIKNLKKEMKDKTLGAYLADLPSQERKRGRHIERSMIKNEFDAIWSKQKQYHPNLLTENLKQQLEEAIFLRRPIFWRLKSIGKCPHEPESPLLMKADWRAQQYIMLQNLNNLRIASTNRELNLEERKLVYDLMMSSAKVSFPKIREELKDYWKENNIPTTSKFNFEYKADEREYLPGNATEALLRKVLGDDYAKHPCSEKIKLEIAKCKFKVESRKTVKGYRSQHKGRRVEIRNANEIKKQKQVFIQKAVEDWQITEKQAKQLVDAPLPKGWIRFSDNVVDQILPYLEEGKEFKTTLDKLYPPHESIIEENRDKLPSHHKVFSDIRNPVVVRCLNETRKVINNLIETYGKPDYIRIELARNIKLVGKDKKKAMEIHNKRRTGREKAKKFLAENNLNITGHNITKHVLWEESNHRCLYSGDCICADDLFKNGRYQIEHIMPYSRSYDNSLNNLLLCKTEMNDQKGNRTPYEAFGNTVQWKEMVKRVKDEKPKLPKPKQKRFIRESYPKELDEEQKNSRLTDTGYATRRVRDFIATLYSKEDAISWTKGQPPRVQVVNGQITSQIGRAWNVYYEFNKKFIKQSSTKKIRDDHRHHTLDAIIVALTSPERAQYIARRFREKREKEIAYEEIVGNLRLRLPWYGFHKDVHDALEKIIVSYRVDAKVSGSFTKDTHMRKQTTKDNEARYVKRIPLYDPKNKEYATADDIRNICDEQVRKLVWNYVRKYDKTGKMPENPEGKTVSKKTINASINDAIKKAFKDINDNPLHMKCKKRNKNGERILGPVIKKVRIWAKQEENSTIPVHTYKRNNKEINIVAKKGDNHHVALYRKDNGEIEKRVISKLQAQQRIQSDKPLIEPKYNGLPLVFSYCKRDVFVKIDPETEKLSFYRVDSIGPVQVTLYLHTNDKLGKYSPSHHTLLTLPKNGFWKITVDPIGRIRLVNKNLAFDYLPNLRKHFE